MWYLISYYCFICFGISHLWMSQSSRHHYQASILWLCRIEREHQSSLASNRDLILDNLIVVHSSFVIIVEKSIHGMLPSAAVFWTRANNHIRCVCSVISFRLITLSTCIATTVDRHIFYKHGTLDVAKVVWMWYETFTRCWRGNYLEASCTSLLLLSLDMVFYCEKV